MQTRPLRLPDTGQLLQAVQLRSLHPSLETEVRAACLVGNGTIRGSALTARYRIRIRYELGSRPRAFVLDPMPQRRHPRQPVIHTNGADNEPCLFTPEHGDWRPDMMLATTIVPWLMEWLVFYEAWFCTGRWDGGGTMPSWWEDLAHEPAPVPDTGAETGPTQPDVAA